MPLEAQIREREGFIERARKRIAKFDEERAAELLRLEESERKLEELRALHKKQDVPPPVQLHTDPAGEVARLQQLVSELQRQLHQGLPVPPTVSRCRVRKREDYVPATEHEVMEWMSDRQEEMNAALVSGNPMEAARISGLITDATKSLLPTPVRFSMETNMVS